MKPQADVEFDAAFADLWGLAYRAAFRLLGNQADAEDIAAECLSRVYARWPKIAGHAQPWAVTVATNLALDRGRRSTTSVRKQHAVASIDTVRNPSVEQRLDIQAALRRLPKRQREVVTLRFLVDWSVEETATALGIDTGTVKRHTSRGLTALQAIVGQEA